MSRFLSPQVARLVAEQGLARAMQEDHREITIVCCDLRGFTPYAAARSSSQVLQVLREYYDAVGDVVSRYGATIKDFAGDGRSEEHTSELQSLMCISYSVFCLQKNTSHKL